VVAAQRRMKQRQRAIAAPATPKPRVSNI
jgi:hypothetical protein